METESNTYPEQGLCANQNAMEQRGVDDNWFVEPTGTHVDEVKQMCNDCPVQAECLEDGISIALNADIRFNYVGIHAGYTQQEIKNMLNSKNALEATKYRLEQRQQDIIRAINLPKREIGIVPVEEKRKTA